MNFHLGAAVSFIVCIQLAGCATPTSPVAKIEAPVSRAEQQQAQKAASLTSAKSYKRKIAVARFSNETQYGRSLLRDGDLDPLGKQASDMLSGRLIASGNFLVFERADVEKIQREGALTNKKLGLVGVDALIIGSVTEFGRFTGGKRGFLSSTKNQIARAKVEVRLVDVHTGLAFFSAVGSGEANTESGEIAGYGSRADYDATLNDRVIAAAISDMLNSLVSKLEERPWRTDILKVDGNQVIISGGKHQGIKVGDMLSVLRTGQKVKSQQSEFDITLPSKEIASIKVINLFGNTETDEGAVCELVNGNLQNISRDELFVAEKKGGGS